jgi:hypothetical protein
MASRGRELSQAAPQARVNKRESDRVYPLIYLFATMIVMAWVLFLNRPEIL